METKPSSSPEISITMNDTISDVKNTPTKSSKKELHEGASKENQSRRLTTTELCANSDDDSDSYSLQSKHLLPISDDNTDSESDRTKDSNESLSNPARSSPKQTRASMTKLDSKRTLNAFKASQNGSSELYSDESGSETNSSSRSSKKQLLRANTDRLNRIARAYRTPRLVTYEEERKFFKNGIATQVFMTEEEAKHQPSTVKRNRRVFIYNKQGRGTSLEILDNWTLEDVYAKAFERFKEPTFCVLPTQPPFIALYFLPNMAEITDIEEIRNDDKLLITSFKLESTYFGFSSGVHARQRSASTSCGLPPLPNQQTSSSSSSSSASSLSGSSLPNRSNSLTFRNPSSILVPVVEPSFYLSFKALGASDESEEKFSKRILEERSRDIELRAIEDHNQEIIEHIESFAPSKDSLPASFTHYHPNHGLSKIYSNSYSNIHGISSINVPGGGGSSQKTPRGVVPQAGSSAGNSSTLAGNMSFSSSSLPSLTLSETDSSHSVPDDVQVVAMKTGMNDSNLKHAFEWQKAEYEIRAITDSSLLRDIWAEKAEEKKEKQRHMSSEEEKEAKRMEKRLSKMKFLSNQNSKTKIPASGASTLSPSTGSSFLSLPISGTLTTPRRRGSFADSASNSKPTAQQLFDAPPNDENVFIDASGRMLGMSIEKAVQRITSDSFPDVAFVRNFLLIYQLFLTPLELLSLLDLRLTSTLEASNNGNSEVGSQMSMVRLRLLATLKLWAGKHPDDLKATEVQRALFAIAHRLENEGKLPNVSQEIENVMHRRRLSSEVTDEEQSNEDFDSFDMTPISYVPPLGAELFDIHPMELARQITIIEKEYLNQIKHTEFLNVSWTKKNKDTIAPNIMAMIRWSNYIVDWMCTEILKYDDVIERAIAINRFIYVGHYCMELNNFNGTFEVLSALKRSSIFRLKNSWNHLPERAWNVFEQIELLFESDSNYKNYRSVLEKSPPPCIPYMGRLLSDILFLEEKEQNYIAGTELLNLVKVDAMATILKFITDLQKTDYCLNKVDSITAYLYSQEILNEKQAYNLSLEREKKNKEPHHRLAELSPSALDVQHCSMRNEIFVPFFNYLKDRCDSNILQFYKSVCDWNQTAIVESDQVKRVRELANNIYEEFIAEFSEKQVWLSQDPLICALCREIEWKIKDDSSPLPPQLFRCLIETIMPTLRYHFDQFRRIIPQEPAKVEVCL